MFSRKVSNTNNKEAARRCRFEPLEARQLLSVSPSVTLIGPGDSQSGAMAIPFDVPVHYGIDGWFSDESSGEIDFSVVVKNGDSTINTDITATILSGNRSLKITVEDVDGDLIDEVMILELFEGRVSETTARFIEMVESGFYDEGVGGTDMTFHRIIEDFMIQGGDPLGTGSGGSGPDGAEGDQIDDEYHSDTRFIGQGVLGSAKSFDDTNDTQFFITDTDTRHLDFQHTIFGQLTDGAGIQDKISALPTLTTGTGTATDTTPATPIVIKSMEIIDDTENGTLFISIPSGTVLTGGETVTITAATPGVQASESVFGIVADDDTWNALPYIPFNSIGAEVSAGDAIVVVEDGSTQFTIPGDDVNGDPVYYAAWDAHTLDTGEDSEFNITYDPLTGLATVSPLSGIEGNRGIWLGVTYISTDSVDFTVSSHPDNWWGDIRTEIYNWSFNDYYNQFISAGYSVEVSQYYADQYAQQYGWSNYISSWDFQFVPVFVTPEAPTDITLVANDDTGTSSSDLLTLIDNSIEPLSFTVTGVTEGRTVVLEIDGQEWGRAVVPTGVDSIVIDTSATAATLADGAHDIRARQVFNPDGTETTQVGNLELDAPVPGDPTALTLTVDATPLQFTTTPATSVYADSNYSYLPSLDAGDLWQYELVDDATYDIPVGMTVNPSTGQVTWTPTTDQAGIHQAAIRAIDLAGNETTQEMTIEVLEQEITIDVAIVETPTDVDGSTGAPIASPPGGGVHQADLPISEWSTYYVEIWVTPSEGADGAWIDLDYNADFHTPGAIEFGPAFTGGQTGTVNSAISRIENLGARTDRDDLGSGPVLLARVSFTAVTGAAGVPQSHDPTTGVLQVVASGISATPVSVELTSGSTFDSPTVSMADAVLAPVIYDMNENGTVDITDLSIFASVFGADASAGGDPAALMADFDDSGSIDITDLSYFAANYGASAGTAVVYPDGLLESLSEPVAQPLAMMLPPQEESEIDESISTETPVALVDQSPSLEVSDTESFAAPLPKTDGQPEDESTDETTAVDTYFTELEESAPTSTDDDDLSSDLTDTLTDDLTPEI